MRFSWKLPAIFCALMTMVSVPAQAESVTDTRAATHMGEELIGPAGVNRRLLQARARIPSGYQRAFNDDRLNPLRAAGTRSGRVKMGQVWSDTVPRRLIEP